MPTEIPTIRLERFAYTPFGTFGRLFLPESSLWTVERWWCDNRPFESCIPEGDYRVRPRRSARFGEVMEVCDVPARTDILFHPANRPRELQGCIAPGVDFGPLMEDGRPSLAVRRSKDGMNKLVATVGRSFYLYIYSWQRTAAELGLDQDRFNPWLRSLVCGVETATRSPMDFTRDVAELELSYDHG